MDDHVTPVDVYTFKVCVRILPSNISSAGYVVDNANKALGPLYGYNPHRPVLAPVFDSEGATGVALLTITSEFPNAKEEVRAILDRAKRVLTLFEHDGHAMDSPYSPT